MNSSLAQCQRQLLGSEYKGPHEISQKAFRSQKMVFRLRKSARKTRFVVDLRSCLWYADEFRHSHQIVIANTAKSSGETCTRCGLVDATMSVYHRFWHPLACNPLIKASRTARISVSVCKCTLYTMSGDIIKMIHWLRAHRNKRSSTNAEKLSSFRKK